MTRPSDVSERAWAFACRHYPGLAHRDYMGPHDPRYQLALMFDAATEDLRELVKDEHLDGVFLAGCLSKSQERMAELDHTFYRSMNDRWHGREFSGMEVFGEFTPERSEG